MVRRAYPREFRERAVQLYRQGGRTFETLAKELGVSSTTLANWAKQADVDQGVRPG